MTAGTDPTTALLAVPVPGGWEVMGAVVQPVHHRGHAPHPAQTAPVRRLQVQLRHPQWPGQVLLLDARSDPAAPDGPFAAPPWRLTYRNTPVPFAAFAAAGQSLAQHLTTLGSLETWPDSPVASPEKVRPPHPKQGWFARESALTAPLFGLEPGQRKTFLAEQLTKHCPLPGPVHLQLYLEGRCRQRCQFCTVPLERQRPVEGPQPPQCRLVADGVLSSLLALLAARPGSLLTLLGDDWAAHPERQAWLALLQQDHGVRIGLLGPGTALADSALRQEVAGIANLDHLTVTLEARPDTPAGRACHDAIVGQAGAAACLDVAVGPLLAANLPLAIACVVVADNVDHLSELIAYCASMGLKLALSGFVPDRCDHPDWQPAQHIARADKVLAALTAAGPLAEQVVTRVAGLPLCAVPDHLHDRTVLTWPSAQTQAWLQPPAGPCARCSAVARCSGVPTAYVTAHEAVGLRALAK
jgi:hypothetical protein